MSPARKLIAVIALLLLAGCGAPPADEASSASLLRDSGGKIRLALMIVSSPARSSLRNQAFVQEFAGKLDEHTNVLILANPEMIIDPSPLPGRMGFIEIPQDLELTIWPQDPFVVLRDPVGGPRLLASRAYGRGRDIEMAEIVGRHLGWPVEPSTLFFAGGNIVSDERNAFVGSQVVRENVSDLGLSEAEIVERFETELGLPVIVVGKPVQPIEHIDMAITPLGGGRIAVADAAGGAELAERALAAEPAIVQAFERYAEQYFFGDPAVTSVTDKEDRIVRAPPVVGGLKQAVADSRSIAPDLDAIAEDLHGRGYEIVRVPLLMSGTAKRQPNRAGYPILSYNNVLLERLDGRERVYVARYGFPPLDSAALKAWEQAGFEVLPIEQVTTSAMYRGSVRCAVKVLERSE